MNRENGDRFLSAIFWLLVVVLILVISFLAASGAVAQVADCTSPKEEGCYAIRRFAWDFDNGMKLTISAYIGRGQDKPRDEREYLINFSAKTMERVGGDSKHAPPHILITLLRDMLVTHDLLIHTLGLFDQAFPAAESDKRADGDMSGPSIPDWLAPFSTVRLPIQSSDSRILLIYKGHNAKYGVMLFEPIYSSLFGLRRVGLEFDIKEGEVVGCEPLEKPIIHNGEAVARQLFLDCDKGLFSYEGIAFQR